MDKRKCIHRFSCACMSDLRAGHKDRANVDRHDTEDDEDDEDQDEDVIKMKM